MDSKSASIIAQVAAKVAAEIVSGSGDVTAYLGVVEHVHQDLLQRQGKGVDSPATNVVPFQAPQSPATTGSTPTMTVPQAFPGATQVPQAPQGGPTGMTKEELWADTVNNPGNWYNNIGDPKAATGGGRGPDLRHKHLKDSKGRNVGLYFVDDRYGKHAPQWAFEHYGVPYPQQPAATQDVPWTQGAPAPVSPPVPTV